jgi:putative membrane protein
MSNGDDDSEDAKGKRRDLSKERTHYAEDRTVLANERTFASWFRTGFASVAIGLGFQALFLKMEPPWVPKAIATLFLLLAIFLFVAAERRACKVLDRLSTHEVKEFTNRRLRIMTILASIGVLALVVAMWTLPLLPEEAQPPKTAESASQVVQ